MSVEWTSDPEAFATPDWTALVLADPEGTLFHAPRYLKLYWEEFGAADLQIALVREGGEAIAAAAFDLRRGRLSFLGGTEVTDYMGPVGPPAARERAAKELMRAVAGRDDWRSADLRGLPEAGSWLRALATGAADAGLRVGVEEDGVDLLLDLPATYDEYLEGLSPKRRHELRRKVRRLREELPEARLVDTTRDSLTHDLDRFVELHRSSTGPKGKFMEPGMELFFRRLADALFPDGIFRLAFLESGGERIAAAVAFRDRNRLLLYNSAYDRARASLSPGIVLVSELISDSIDEGLRAMDMLKGNLKYKYQFGARPRTICRVRLGR
ncbi:MAG TPA: GNAT family N-acetyltransferase [Actinomycetota bacterium]|jgi:CelD/BcsL family acetyltransferase involved in cellulose biosynthesis|nr:GNAT family N-acetyltransferase [Actinomycetota bacterium]